MMSNLKIVAYELLRIEILFKEWGTFRVFPFRVNSLNLIKKT
jgi:hypothetical protein